MNLPQRKSAMYADVLQLRHVIVLRQRLLITSLTRAVACTAGEVKLVIAMGTLRNWPGIASPRFVTVCPRSNLRPQALTSEPPPGAEHRDPQHHPM